CFITAPLPTAIYTLSLHDALPISVNRADVIGDERLVIFAAAHGSCPVTHSGLQAYELERSRISGEPLRAAPHPGHAPFRARRTRDRKSTRLNSSHRTISYAVFCLK